MNRLSYPPPSAAQQRGNALIWALLGLIISGLGAVAYVRNKQSEFKAQAGQTEASVLASLSKATHLAISEHMLDIQRGNAITKTVDADTVTVMPSLISGESVWRLSTDELRRMGYLPPGWNTSTSALNGAPYSISFRRTPAGCLPAHCNIEGAVVLEGPIAEPGSARSDAAIIGSLLTHIGVDAATSLPNNPTQLTGFGPGGSWSMANPVAGNPPGVVAVRLGTAASAYTPFVRIGDLRDPKLAGDLTALGNLSIGGSGSLQGALSVEGAITTPKEVIATGALTGATLKFNAPVNEGDACEPTALATLSGGGLAICNATGTYQTLFRYERPNTPCTRSQEGLGAIDSDSGQSLICHQEKWTSLEYILSRMNERDSFLAFQIRTLDAAINKIMLRN